MAFQTHKNFAYSTIATAPSPAASGTSLVVAAGEGTYFPAVPFQASIWPVTTIPTPANAEVVTVTAVSTDTLTITRAQESSSARTVVVGDQIAATITNKTLTDIETVSAPTEQTTTATGAQADFSLTNGFTFLRCTGAAPVFSGFTVAGSAPAAGDRVIIHCLGTTSAKVTSQDAGSTDVNRVITPSSAGQIVGGNGDIELIYDGTTSRWRIDDVHPGKPIDVAFASGNFTASTGDWTLTSPDQVVYRYQQEGRRIFLEFNFNNTTVSATPTGLRFEFGVATGFTVSGRVLQPCRLDDAGTAAIGQADFNSSVAYIQLSKLSGSWSTATNTTSVSGNFFITVD